MGTSDLTDTTLTLLALIGNKPVNPYRINKVLAGSSGTIPFSIKESTCYASMRTLERKGLIAGNLYRNSSMPAKKIYSITAAGQKKLSEHLVQTLTNLEEASSSFEKAIHFICSIPRGEAVQAIQRHRTILENDMELLRSRYEAERLKRHVPFTTRILTRRLLKKRQVELDTLNELKKEIEWSERWDYSPFNFAADERGNEEHADE